MKTTDAQHSVSPSTECLPIGTSLLGGQYVIERYLGSGGFGITYVARDSLDRLVVIKECFPEAICQRKKRTVVERSRGSKGQFHSIVDMFVREARSLAKLQHPNIVGVHQVFKDNETAYMALDLVKGRDLLDIIECSKGQPPYQETYSILFRLLQAISVVHDEDMLHRDISPDNILIDVSGGPVLIDFGAAREEASKKSRALSAVQIVKDGYSPQEFYVAGSTQGPSSDLYALAATFSHLITGEAPPNSQIRLAAVASGKPDPYEPLAGRVEGYPKVFLETLDHAMAVHPKDRIQDARSWMARIDQRSEPTVPYTSPKAAQDIERTVTELVKKAERIAPKMAAPKPAKATKAPGVAERSKEKDPREEYRKRFGELAQPLDMDGISREVPRDTGPDWIERARMKQAERVAGSKKMFSRPRRVSPRPKTRAMPDGPKYSPPRVAPAASRFPMLLAVFALVACSVVVGLNAKQFAAFIAPHIQQSEDHNAQG